MTGWVEGSSYAPSGLFHIDADPGFRFAAPWAEFLRRFAALLQAIFLGSGRGGPSLRGGSVSTLTLSARQRDYARASV